MLCPEDQEQLTQLELEKVSLEHLREDLVRQLTETDRALKENAIQRANLAPVSRIPDDVLRMIFEQAYQPCQLSDLSLFQPSGISDCARSRLVATQVSRRWRATAVSFPTIWTCIHVGKSIDLLCLWAHRSAPFPLHIVYLQPYRSCMSQVKFLLLHAHRWKTLHGGSIRPMLDLLKYYQDIGSPVLPLLKCAYLSDRDPMKVSHSLASRCALPFPSLVSLTLNNFHVLFRISKLSNLRKLTLEESAITPTELSGLSIAAPGLSVLLLRQVDREVNGDSERIVTFRSLTELCFVSMNWEAILSHINAPCLKTLSCTGGYLRPSFVGFTQTFPLLTHIHLGQCKVQNWNNRNTHDGHLFRHTPNENEKRNSLRYTTLIKFPPIRPLKILLEPWT